MPSEERAHPRVAAISGGVGGAKMVVGLQRALRSLSGALTVVVNTGDDDTIYGVHVSPDLDIVTYWLAGLADTKRGWGMYGDTFSVVQSLRDLGHDAWFNLGDRDFATCIYRTERLAAGATLSEVTAEVAVALGVEARLLPMSDDPVRTSFVTTDERELSFQEYFVKHRCEPAVAQVLFSGVADAHPAPQVLDSLAQADVVVICPSNPIVSTGPILAVPGIRETLRLHPNVVAVTPLVQGVPLRGPADVLLAATGAEVSTPGVAALYADICNLFVVDERDGDEVEAIRRTGVDAIALDTVMTDHDASQRLAEAIIAAAGRGLAA